MATPGMGDVLRGASLGIPRSQGYQMFTAIDKVRGESDRARATGGEKEACVRMG